jgi:hypothetical protein
VGDAIEDFDSRTESHLREGRLGTISEVGDPLAVAEIDTPTTMA